MAIELKKEIDTVQKKRKVQNNIRRQRYRDKEKNEAINLKISKHQTITAEELEKIKRQEQKQNSRRYRDKKREPLS